MFIENGTPKYPKAPAGRHVYRWGTRLGSVDISSQPDNQEGAQTHDPS